MAEVVSLCPALCSTLGPVLLSSSVLSKIRGAGNTSASVALLFRAASAEYSTCSVCWYCGLRGISWAAGEPLAVFLDCWYL